MASTVFVLIISLCFTSFAGSQKVGEPCVVKQTNATGRCELASQCDTARVDYVIDRIYPTFCDVSAPPAPTLCCRNNNLVDPNITWATIDSGRKMTISQNKCAEYNRDVGRPQDFIPLVLGGETADLGEFPHMAAIGWSEADGTYKFKCGGSLISPRWVVTAGHCTRDPRARDPSPVVVRLGDHNINPAVDDGARPVDVPIKSMKQHPDYKPPIRYNDIALIELAHDVVFSNGIRPACLWTSEKIDRTKAVATGWGVTDLNTAKSSTELQKVTLDLVDNNLCDQLLAGDRNSKWWMVAQTQVCAGELKGGKGTCKGDSGSPLQITSKQNPRIFFIIGVVSTGRRCALSGQPTLFTRISSFVPWIESVVWPKD